MSDAMRERAGQMRDRVDQDYPDAWDFKELPVLVGVVESFARVESEYGPKVVATIREVDGAEKRWAVWLSQAGLRNRFRDLDIREGELVAIRYLGVGEAAKPGWSPPHRFRVEVDRGQGGSGFDWGSISDDDVASRVVYDDRDRERYSPRDEDIPF